VLPFNVVVRTRRREVVCMVRCRWIRVSGALGMGNESSMGLVDGEAMAAPSVAITVF
jgi:hypothetical protein